jgi:hypothetical protein
MQGGDLGEQEPEYVQAGLPGNVEWASAYQDDLVDGQIRSGDRSSTGRYCCIHVAVRGEKRNGVV